ncbi:MAG: hypothetical protein LUD74_03945 [Tannerellaceae bacterium]|nr:hypothetical protein [Tannerellaceae bacterium]
MTAKYQLFRKPGAGLKEKSKGLLYPRIVPGRTIRLEEISSNISAKSTFSPGDIVGVWESIKNEIWEALKKGYRVDLEGLGSFYPLLRCREVDNPKEIRAESIQFSKVAYTPAQELHKHLRYMELERAGNSPEGQHWNATQRQERIIEYLHRHATLISSVCSHLNSCSRDTAQKDLKALFEAGRIVRQGGKYVSIYSLNRGEEAP